MSAARMLLHAALVRRSVRIAAGLLAAIVLLILLGPLLSPYAPDYIDLDGAWGAPPQWADAHWFGTDSLGRDLFARTLAGGRVSLAIGLAATLVSLGIGASWGALAGYLGGRTDLLMMRVVDVLYALPFMFLVILLTVLCGRHLLLMFAALGAINWLDMARIVRGQTLALRRREFVDAALLCGLTTTQILRRHILPNLAGVIVVQAALTVPQVILTESFLSFLGLGVPEPATSWGALVNDGAREMQSAPWSLVFPAGLLAVTLLCLNLLGDGLRDALDPRTRSSAG